jgi:hypothetical protein
MIEKLILLYSFYSGGEIGEMLQVWENAGFFAYLLPFLLIFALVYAILMRINVFKDSKAIPAIIALAVGLMALQFDFVPIFFSEIFPRLGVGLAILLCVLILAGIFIDPEKSVFTWILLGIGALILIVVLIQTADVLNWSAGWWWADNWELVAGAVFILILIGIIVGGSSDKSDSNNYRPLAFFEPKK